MDWHFIRHVDTAEEQIVAGLGGIDLDQWEATPIARAPDEFERVVDGEIVLDTVAIDSALHARIDRAAGEVRCRFITDVAGQQLTYDRKEREARAWLAAEAPEIADYPFIAAEAAATGVEPGAAAAEIVAAADAWAGIGSAIEGLRIGAKRAVTAASTREAKEAAAAVDWEAQLP
jgi:hypothetical protein